MKHRLLKAKTITGFLLACIILVIPMQAAFAGTIEIAGNDTGLKVISSNKDLLNLNLNPGDSNEGIISMQNKKNDPFRLYLKANRLDNAPAAGSPDLYTQILIDAVYDGTTIYSGSLSGFATGNGLDLGVLNSGQTKKLNVKISLPGKETGNEFMGQKSSCQWIFTAVNEARCTLIIKVVDAATKKALPGAVCAVYKDAAMTQLLYGNLIMDSKGQITLEELMPGTYYVKETKAPYPYFLNKVTVPVTLQNNQTMTVVIENTAESPYQTGTEDYNNLFIGGLLLVAGSTFVFFSRKKIKEK